MSSIDELSSAFESLKQSHAAGRLAHAYIIVGSPRGDAQSFAESLLRLLVCTVNSKPCGRCEACRQVTEHAHPDLYWLEPENKSRQLSIDQIRELTSSLSKSAFAGGWKAGILVAADRMNENSANAFLKTLEEPPDKCLLLLLTDAPQALLPTIVSRCQRIVLSRESADASARWRGQLLDVLRKDASEDVLQSLQASSGLTRLLAAIKEEIEGEIPPDDGEVGKEDEDDEASDDRDENTRKSVREARIRSRLLEARHGLLRDMMLWHRDVMLCRMGVAAQALHFASEEPVLRRQASRLSERQAIDRLTAVEALSRRLERNLSPDLAIDLAWLTMAGKTRPPVRK